MYEFFFVFLRCDTSMFYIRYMNSRVVNSKTDVSFVFMCLHDTGIYGKWERSDHISFERRQFMA